MTRFAHLRALLHGLLLLVATVTKAQSMPQGIVFERLSANSQLPANEINHFFQDHTGFIWIGTERGLYRFDGYRMKRYRNTPAQPHVLTSNVVTNLSEDKQNRLWIGTRKGITCINETRDESREYHFRDFGNSDLINRILVTRSGTVWVGTEGGLYRYAPDADQFVLLCDQRKNSKVPHCSVTSLVEDKQGYVWIGTWDKGLFRYDPKKDTFYAMPQFNDLNSAQTVFEDHEGRLWVGTWGRGIYCIQNPYDTDQPLQFQHYDNASTGGALLSDIVWDLNEDHYTRLLWIGTAKGLCFMPLSQGMGNIFPLPEALLPEPDLFVHGVGSFYCDQRGRMWMNAYERGIVSTSTRPATFATHALPRDMQVSDHISVVRYDRSGNLIVGMSHSGLLTDGGATAVPMPSKVNAILSLPSGELLVGTQRNGLVTVDHQRIVRQQDRTDTPWLPDNCIFSLAQDAEGNLLVGTWRGLSVQYADGRGLHLEGKNLKALEMAHMERQRALNQLEEYKQKTYEKVREDLFADICGISLSDTDENFVRQSLTCMQRHISDTEFDLPHFADAMCMSKSSLYKRLRATTGLSTSAFIRTVRMKSARELLRQNPKVRIADVAYAVGYNDPKYFSTCFKKDFGLLPTEYAEQCEKGQKA